MTNTMTIGEALLSKTLSCIDHVLRFYYSPEHFETHDQTMHWLLDHELIAVDGDGWWRVTDRGKVYCEMVRDVPLPVLVTEWRDPRE